MKIQEFQQLISKKYGRRDNRRGTAATYMWFVEEVGELASALASDSSKEQKAAEFADVFAWLCTLANINDVDIARACEEKYGGNGVPGFK